MELKKRMEFVFLLVLILLMSGCAVEGNEPDRGR